MKEIKLNSPKVLIVVVAVAVILLPGRYGLDNLNVLKAEAEQIRSEANNLNVRSELAEQEVITNADVFQAREDAANAAIPKEADTANLIDTLASKAAENNLVWVSGTPTPLGDTMGIGSTYSLNISLQTADGSTGNNSVIAVSNFLESVRNLDRLVVVDNVTFSPESGTASIQARFFSQAFEE